jgi:hypothetical protein
MMKKGVAEAPRIGDELMPFFDTFPSLICFTCSYDRPNELMHQMGPWNARGCESVGSIIVSQKFLDFIEDFHKKSKVFYYHNGECPRAEFLFYGGASDTMIGVACLSCVCLKCKMSINIWHAVSEHYLSDGYVGQFGGPAQIDKFRDDCSSSCWIMGKFPVLLAHRPVGFPIFMGISKCQPMIREEDKEVKGRFNLAEKEGYSSFSVKHYYDNVLHLIGAPKKSEINQSEIKLSKEKINMCFYKVMPELIIPKESKAVVPEKWNEWHWENIGLIRIESGEIRYAHGDTALEKAELIDLNPDEFNVEEL